MVENSVKSVQFAYLGGRALYHVSAALYNGVSNYLTSEGENPADSE